jgi:hypothetical protein
MTGLKKTLGIGIIVAVPLISWCVLEGGHMESSFRPSSFWKTLGSDFLSIDNPSGGIGTPDQAGSNQKEAGPVKILNDWIFTARPRPSRST